jgi:hypothetical protein
MNFDFIALGIGVSFGVNFFLLFTRKKSWNTDELRWIITSILFIIGFLGLADVLSVQKTGFNFFSWCLLNPLAYNILDRIFKKVSLKKSNRDFYLWLRGSFEIDDSFYGKNPHVNVFDKIFSITLLIFNVALPTIGTVLLN